MVSGISEGGEGSSFLLKRLLDTWDGLLGEGVQRWEQESWFRGVSLLCGCGESARRVRRYLPKGILAAVEGWVRGLGVDGAKGTSARHLGGPVLDRYCETCQKDGVFMDGRANGGEGRTHQGVSVSQKCPRSQDSASPLLE